MGIWQLFKENTALRTLNKGKSPNTFSRQVKNTETSCNNPSVVVCSLYCSLSRMAAWANSRQGLEKFQHPFILKCLPLSAWKALHPCTAILTLPAFENPKLFPSSTCSPSSPKENPTRLPHAVLQVTGPRTHQKLCSFYILYSHPVQGSPVTPTYPHAFCLFDSEKLTYFTNETS